MFPFLSRKQKRASRINVKAPAAGEGRSGLALVAIVKNEERHIFDWLAFHTLAGVKHFFIYDNLSTDRTVDIARGFSGCNVTVIPWQLNCHTNNYNMILPRQIVAYAHAICTFGSQFERMAFIDIDEYLVPRSSLSIADCLSSVADFSNISLPWAMYGHSGLADASDLADPFAFTFRAPESRDILLNYKCIVDPCRVTQVSTHKFETIDLGKKSANTEGALENNRSRGASFATFAELQLNHYYLRSEREMRGKISDGAVSGVEVAQREKAILAKAEMIEAGPVFDDAAIQFLARHGVFSTEELRAKFR